MSRKIYITVPINLIVRADEGVTMEQLREDLIVTAHIANDRADVEDTEVGQLEVTDSK